MGQTAYAGTGISLRSQEAMTQRVPQSPIRDRLKDLNIKAHYLLVALSFIYRSGSATWALKLAFILTAFVAVLPVQDISDSALWLRRIRNVKIAFLIAALVFTLFWILSATGGAGVAAPSPTQGTASPVDTNLPGAHWYHNPEWVLVIVGAITFAFIGWQSWETRRAARAAEKSAEAASLNATALINAERAWIIARVDWRDPRTRLIRGDSSGGKVTTGAFVNVLFQNEGRTPAWITEIAIKMQVTNAGPSRQPDMGGAEVLYGPIPLVQDTEEPHIRTFDLIADGWPDTGWTALIYGVVKYRDVLTEDRHLPDRETWFGYWVTPGLEPVR